MRARLQPSSSARVTVLHLIESDGVYGAEQVVLALAREAARDGEFRPVIGCLVKDVSAPHPLHEYARALGLDAIKLPLRNAQCAWDLSRLVARLGRLGVGIVHANGYKAAIAAFATHAVFRTPILATCHLWFTDSQCKWTYRALSQIERRLYRWFDHVVAVSPPIAGELRAWGVDSARLHVIANGIAMPSRPSPAIIEALRREVGATDGEFVLLNIGRLAEQKAQLDLVEAVAKLRASGARVRLVILGEGHLRDEIRARVERYGLGSAVSMPGFRGNARDYLAIADAFVLPSVDEGLPIALLEAAAARVPIVCTAVGAIPTLFEDGASAVFVPVHSPEQLAAALGRLMDEPGFRARLADRAAEIVRRSYSAESMYRQYRELYVNALEPWLATGRHAATEAAPLRLPADAS